MSDDVEAAVPNCPECLTRLEPAGDEERPFWWCPTCQVARIVA